LGQATTALDALIAEDPNFVEAHDVLGRAHFELGQFDRALATYKQAAEITPSAVSRLQNLAMMTHYAGDQAEARRLLDRATRIGLESKLFDPQAVVLLALSRLGIEDRRGLQRCQDDFVRLLGRPDNRRIRRLAGIVDMAVALQRRETAQVLQTVPAMAADITHIDFDYESAGNLLALLTHMRLRNVHFHDAELAVKTMGMRFCSNRSVTELLAHAPPRTCRMRGTSATRRQRCWSWPKPPWRTAGPATSPLRCKPCWSTPKVRSTCA